MRLDGLEDFRVDEKRILDTNIEGKQEEARKKGLISTLPENGLDVGYIIFLRYDVEAMSPVVHMSEEINSSLDGRAAIYDRSNIHENLGDFGLHHIDGGSFDAHDAVLRVMSDMVCEVFFSYRDFARNEGHGALSNRFSRYIYNNNSVVLRPAEEGISEEAFKLVELTYFQSLTKGLDNLRDFYLRGEVKDVKPYRKAWGSHITVSRFTDTVPRHEMGFFNELMEGSEFTVDHNVVAESVNVGFFEANRERGFRLTTVVSYSF